MYFTLRVAKKRQGLNVPNIVNVSRTFLFTHWCIILSLGRLLCHIRGNTNTQIFNEYIIAYVFIRFIIFVSFSLVFKPHES